MKNKKKKLLVLISAIVLIALFFCINVANELYKETDICNLVSVEDKILEQNKIVIPENIFNHRERLCQEFIEEKMIIQGNGIMTNYLEQESKYEIATGSEILSESQGLAMKYYLELKDKEKYDDLLEFIKQHLNKQEGISYRYNVEENENWTMNAAIDDLRIIGSLLDAYEIFGKYKYIELANEWGSRLYNTNVIENSMHDFYDWKSSAVNEFITLSYIDLNTLRKMAINDKRWDSVQKNMETILLGGYISDDFPMFKEKYNYSNGEYEFNQSINMLDSTLIALNLARVNRIPEKTLEFLKQKVENGELYTDYSVSGELISNKESTAIYAICAIIANEIGDEEFYKNSIEQMNRFQVLNNTSEIYGAFGDQNTLKVYASDNLIALLAYRRR